jgi:hypothetical protein
MLPGTRDQARPPAAWVHPAIPPTIRFNGGFTFAERPDLEAPDARIIWHADIDPATLRVAVIPVDRAGPDHLEVARLAPWLSVVVDGEGREHAVLSDGWRHVRIDVEAGSLAENGLVLLEYRLVGLASAQSSASALRRFLQLAIHCRFGASFFPPEPQMARWTTLLRVSDALRAGASQREIARALFGEERVDQDWDGHSDSLRSRVRRLVRDARAMARGGYRFLLRKDGRSSGGPSRR